MDKIGVAGLGRMGAAMAKRMASQGAEVTGWSRSGVPDGLGITPAQSLAELAVASDTILLSLFDDAAVEAVLGALLKEPLSGKLIIDTSTVSPTLLKNHLGQADAAGAALIDAPISGGPEMVANATCGVFIGGAEPEAMRARAAIELFSTRVFHVGPLGAGMGMKIANNALIAGTLATLSEVLQIARGVGLDFETTMRVVSGGPAGAPFLAARMEKILGKDDSVGFPVSGTLKDVGVFRAAAAELGVAAPVLARAEELMEMAASEGLADRDAAILARAAWDRE